MAQTTVSVRMDDALKRDFDAVCNDLGLSMTTAITMLAKKMTREKRLPFEVSIDPDPFFSESNIRYLEGKMNAYRTGQLKLEEHDLIEE